MPCLGRVRYLVVAFQSNLKIEKEEKMKEQNTNNAILEEFSVVELEQRVEFGLCGGSGGGDGGGGPGPGEGGCDIYECDQQ